MIGLAVKKTDTSSLCDKECAWNVRPFSSLKFDIILQIQYTLHLVVSHACKQEDNQKNVYLHWVCPSPKYYYAISLRDK